MNLHLATFSSRARKWVSSLIVCRCCKHASKSTWIADRAYTLLNGVTFRAGLRLQLKINPPSSDYPEPEAHAGILHIKNLPGHTNNKLLYELFRPFGPMILCKILVEHASTFKGTALVQYFNPQDAQDAESMMVKTVECCFSSHVLISLSCLEQQNGARQHHVSTLGRSSDTQHASENIALARYSPSFPAAAAPPNQQGHPCILSRQRTLYV